MQCKASERMILKIEGLAGRSPKGKVRIAGLSFWKSGFIGSKGWNAY